MRTRHSGFTLFELMIGLGIMGILVSLAVPSFQEYGRSSRVVGAQNDLVTAFNYARSEAIRRATPVTVCATSTFGSCGTDVNWPEGWLAFVDADADNIVDAGEEILQVWRGPGGANASFVTIGVDTQAIQFTATGLVNPNTGSKTYRISSTSCVPGTRLLRSIQVNPIGSILNERRNCL